MRALALALAVLAGLARPAAAEDQEFLARLAVAAEYRELLLETTDLSVTARAGAQPLLDAIAAHQPQLWAEKGERIAALVVDCLVAQLRDTMRDLDAQLAAAFSMEELVALRDFYASEAGRSVLAKLPAFMQDVMPGIMQSALATTDDLLAALKAEGVDIQ